MKEFHEMDMRIDPRVLRAERQKRAWSQEHLANATGLGLRTIQRIEAQGTASHESTSALAAVLSLPLERLMTYEPVTAQARHRPTGSRGLIGLGTAVFVGICAVLGYSFAVADDIALDVGVFVFDEGEDEPGQVAMTKLLVADGDDADLEVDGVARFVIRPTVREDGLVLIAVEVLEFDGSDYVSTRSPRVLTENGREAEIVFGSDSGNVFRISVTPNEPTGEETR
jgi:transcriptional regulator with XRE-family HTH domain